MTPLTEQAEEYAEPLAEDLHRVVRRAFMAGALEASRRKPTDVIRECLDYAKTIGTAAERIAAVIRRA